MFVTCTVFVLSGRGLCDGLITSPEESYRLSCVSECDQAKSQKPSTAAVNKQVEEGRTTKVQEIFPCPRHESMQGSQMYNSTHS
jgi:hypothetical protein